MQGHDALLVGWPLVQLKHAALPCVVYIGQHVCVYKTMYCLVYCLVNYQVYYLVYCLVYCLVCCFVFSCTGVQQCVVQSKHLCNYISTVTYRTRRWAVATDASCSANADALRSIASCTVLFCVCGVCVCVCVHKTQNHRELGPAPCMPHRSYSNHNSNTRMVV